MANSRVRGEYLEGELWIVTFDCRAYAAAEFKAANEDTTTLYWFLEQMHQLVFMFAICGHHTGSISRRTPIVVVDEMIIHPNHHSVHRCLGFRLQELDCPLEIRRFITFLVVHRCDFDSRAQTLIRIFPQWQSQVHRVKFGTRRPLVICPTASLIVEVRVIQSSDCLVRIAHKPICTKKLCAGYWARHDAPSCWKNSCGRANDTHPPQALYQVVEIHRGHQGPHFRH